MARIRTIKPELPHSESMGNVSRDSRLCFLLLFTLADDEGRLRGNSRMLASLLYPYDDDAPKRIDDWLGQLEFVECITRYIVDGASYVEIRNWLTHQKIDKPSRSKLPPPPGTLANPREESSEDQGSRIKDQGSGGDHARAVPRGAEDAGDALGKLADDALAEVLGAWKDVERVDSQAMETWLAHWSRCHAGREMPSHQRISAAKLLAGLGDPDAQRRAVNTAEANGWKALRPGDGRAPKLPPGAVDPGKLAAAEQRKWAEYRERARKVGFREPREGEDLLGYRTLLEREESKRPRSSGPQSIAKLLPRGNA